MDAETLARKKAMRRAQRSVITRTITQVEELVSSEVLNEAKLRQKQVTLSEKREIVKTLDAEILESVSNEELETEIEGADEVQERITIALIAIDDVLKSPPTRDRPPPTRDRPRPLEEPPSSPSPRATPPEGTPPTTGSEDTPSVMPTLVTPPIISMHSRVKLPELTLKRFGGDLIKWGTFWDTFESTIHKRSDLSDVEKFSYLLTLLESSAAEAVAGLALTSANYQEAVSTLKKRYGNKQLIISRHMDVLMNLETVGSQGDVKKLRRLFYVVETQVRGLKALGVTAESYGALLSSTLLNKLPPEIRLIVSRGLTDDGWDLDTILQLFEAELLARERAASTSQPKKALPGRQPPTASALVAPATMNCIYCGQGHTSTQCSVVPTVEARKQSLKQAGRCYICLRRNHISRNCRSSLKCSRCRGKHHDSICHQSGRREVPNGESINTRDASTNHSTVTPVMFVNAQTKAMLQTATVVVQNARRSCHSSCRVRAVLDCGSQRTYITSRIQKKLSLPTSAVELVEIKTFGTTEGSRQPCNLVELQILTKDGCKLGISALVVPYICEVIENSLSEEMLRQHPHLVGLDLADGRQDSTHTTIDLLIGADLYWTVVSGRILRGNSGPTAIETRVGWVLSGPVRGSNIQQSNTETHVFQVNTSSASTNLEEDLRRFWDLESIGIHPTEESIKTRFTEKITFRNGRYEVNLPWRLDRSKLSNNYDICVKRLHGLRRRLHQDPELLSAYDEILKDQLRGGIIEEVMPSADLPLGAHYLPHHPVVRRDKSTTKVRIVYDASCSGERGLSLNQCLHVGPSFDQFIFDILLRFRTHCIAIVGDVEKAFLMVGVATSDRDVLRFLWFDDPQSPSPRMVTYRFTRVVFGVSSSPFLLNATIQHHIEQYKQTDPVFVTKFLRGVYVDDLSSGGPSVEACYEFYLKSKERLAEGGFNLRKFVSNSPELLERIHEGQTGSRNTNCHPDHTKVLGISWDPTQDELQFDIRFIGKQLQDLCPATKRAVVGIAAKVYDPLGILSPVTITFKVFFQQLCRARLNWDEPLTNELSSTWQSLMTELSQLDPIVIPRHLPGLEYSNDTSISLVGFCDASMKAYAAVVYLRVVCHAGTFASLLASKTRVAPIKTITIPRLELLSALLLARLVHAIGNAMQEEIRIDQTVCFTDSKIALAWIQHEQEWKQFVENRVSEVRKLVAPDYWRHCPGVENMADIPSRGLKPKEFQKVMKQWTEGPDWLKDEQLPCWGLENNEVPEECMVEVRWADNQETVLLGVIGEQDSVINIEKFSTFRRLRRVMGQVYRFLRLLKGSQAMEISTSDLHSAHNFLIRTAQKSLAGDRKLELWKRQLELFTDEEGILRCKGRLANANIPTEMKFPILLHKHNAITRLIVKECHERTKHGGVGSTLTELRARYWVIQGRQLVKQIVHDCIICRRYQCASYSAPCPPPLPLIRVDEKPPFSYTGVDFAGPLFTREGLSSEAKKVWICLFTCCVTRAVHMELVTEMRTEAFLRCFKRFLSRRGTPIRLLSDNAKTFRAADKWLSDAVNHPDVKSYMLESGIRWQFNVERAPWWGGVFERMIQSAKRLLRKIVGTAKLTFDELSTAVIEVEALLNSRPLTYISATETIEPLTPSHLLCGRRILTLPDEPGDNEDTYSPDGDTASRLTRRMKHLARTIENMWSRWRNEYLLELRNAHRTIRSKQGAGTSGPKVAIGDVVIVEDALPRGFWKLAVVIELLTGRDKEVRAATVKTHSKDGKVIFLKRPVQKLYPLEIQDTDQGLQAPQPELMRKSIAPTSEDIKGCRPKRGAALHARERIAGWIKDLADKTPTD